VRTCSSLDSIDNSREYDTTTINNMMAMITAKLVKIRWRNVQFFKVLTSRVQRDSTDAFKKWTDSRPKAR
jgi:hypothetical protein